MSFCFPPLTTSLHNIWSFKFENYVGLLCSTCTTSDFGNFWIMSFCFPPLRTSDFWNLRIMSLCFPALTTYLISNTLTASDFWNLRIMCFAVLLLRFGFLHWQHLLATSDCSNFRIMSVCFAPLASVRHSLHHLPPRLLHQGPSLRLPLSALFLSLRIFWYRF